MENQKHLTLDEMRPIIERWEVSGLTKKEFCDQQQIAPSVFYYWYKKYKTQDNSSGFIPIKIKSTTYGDHLEIIYPNGVKLKLSPDVSPAMLRQYIYL
jgi:hypothetical protein